ncbi:MAG: hypothetical protein IKV47_08325, partial [Oscillospiraceae bacterium]|nr:hypothetical protein [Oscillospiraceae bacterium]
MKNNVKNYITIGVFAFVIFALAVMHIVIPDAETSRAERRKLAQLPEITWEGVFSGDYMEELETYLLDQFPLRDGFRGINAVLKTYILGQSDNNDIFLYNGGIYKVEAELDEKQVQMGANKINSITDKFLEGMNVYYSIIPDKGYYIAGESGRPAYDYDKLVSIMNEGVTQAQYIDIFGLLTIDDYYRTDTHWSQDRIYPVIEKLAGEMGALERITPYADYTAHTLEPFYGVYLGQSGLPVDPDVITYMQSADTENAIVTSAEYAGTKSIYELADFEKLDGYDVFLGGAQALLTIECP